MVRRAAEPVGGATATIASLPLGIGLGYLLARRQFPGKSLVETVLSLPLVLPPVVTGYLLLVAFGRRGFIGQYLEHGSGCTSSFTWKGSGPGFGGDGLSAHGAGDPRWPSPRWTVRLEQVARTLGAGPFDTFFRGQPAAGTAGRHRRCGAGLRAQHRRVRRDHHGRRQHSG